MTNSPLPSWAKAMLQAKGAMSESGLTRTAGIRTHRPCRTPCLAGIDDTGLDTWCDLVELSPAGEVHALLDDRPTYNLCLDQLCHRGPMRVAGTPAGDPGEPTFAEHRCRQPIPGAWAAPPVPPKPDAPAKEMF